MVNLIGRWSTLALLVAMSTAWLLLSCASALAHSALLESNPGEKEVVEGSPEQVRLEFSEPVEAAFDPIKVYDYQQQRVDLEDARVDPADPNAVAVGLKELPGGPYTVEWRVTSGDGHVVEGTYEFSVINDSREQPQESAEADPGSTQQQNSGSWLPTAGFAAMGLVVLALVGLLLSRRR